MLETEHSRKVPECMTSLRKLIQQPSWSAGHVCSKKARTYSSDEAAEVSMELSEKLDMEGGWRPRGVNAAKCRRGPSF